MKIHTWEHAVERIGIFRLPLLFISVLMILLALTQPSCTSDDFLDVMDRERAAGIRYFPNTEIGVYWTNTEWFGFAAVFLDFTDGSVNGGDYTEKHFIRCVTNINPGGVPVGDPQENHSVYFKIPATGQEISHAKGDDAYYSNNLPEMSFIDNKNGTVRDGVTGLIWTKCSLGNDYSVDVTSSCTETHGKYSWSDAVLACEDLEIGGRNDWVLPTLSELLTIVDYGAANPAIK